VSLGEHDHEPVPGLPGRLPSGEQLLWQGRPDWWLLARGAYRIHWLAGYFALIALWRAATVAGSGAGARTALASLLLPMLLGLGVCALLAGVAWLAARCTVYSVTNRRVVIRHGIAVPMALNLPFAQIEGAALCRRSGGGDVALQLVPGQRIGYLVNWPHVRPGRYTQPQATLRALREVEAVGKLLGASLAASVTAAPPPAAASRPRTAGLAGADRVAA
jgi:hypothetical protein